MELLHSFLRYNRYSRVYSFQYRHYCLHYSYCNPKYRWNTTAANQFQHSVRPFKSQPFQRDSHEHGHGHGQGHGHGHTHSHTHSHIASLLTSKDGTESPGLGKLSRESSLLKLNSNFFQIHF